MADNAIVAPNPIVVVEVLSPSTKGSDTGGKRAGYFSIRSIAHYLIVHPTKRQVIHHRRTPWGIDTSIRQDGEIVLDPPGVTVAIDQFYAVA